MRDAGERCDHAVFVSLFSNQRPVDDLDIDGSTRSSRTAS
jgi:hypothetical protein